MKRKKMSAFTLVELIITLVIVGIMLGSGFMYMSGYLPKERLKSTASGVLNLLQLAQSRAMTHSTKYGVYFKTNAASSPTKIYACMFREYDPTNSQSALDGKCTNCENTVCADCKCGEAKNNPYYLFKDGIGLLNCNAGGVQSVITGSTATDTILFDLKGFAYDRGGSLRNFEIYAYNTTFSAGQSRVKEIEVGSGGLIELMKPSQGTGNFGGQANTSCP